MTKLERDRMSILLTVVAVLAGISLLGAGALTMLLTALDPTIDRLDAISNYVGGGLLVMISGALIAVATTRRL